MNIIIAGSEPISLELAEYLVKDRHDVTLVDRPSPKMAEILNRYDIRVIQGMPSHPDVLRSASAENADLIVATTQDDELNIAVCSVAHSLFAVPRKIARIRSDTYLKEMNSLFRQGDESRIPVDHVISPEQLVTEAIQEIIQFPGSQSVTKFLDDRVVAIQVRAKEGGQLVGQALEKLNHFEPKAVVLAAYRNNKMLKNLAEETLQVGDEIFFCAQRTKALYFMTAITPLQKSGTDIYIAGGTDTADEVAEALSYQYHVKLLEPSSERAAMIEDRFRHTSVDLYCADPTSVEFYDEENIGESSVVITANPYDETNIMTLLMLRRQKKLNTISVIRNKALIDMVEGLEDEVTVVSPREATISALLTHIRQEGVVKTTRVRVGESEMMELVVRGSKRGSGLIDKTLEQINLPDDAKVGLVLRESTVIKPGQDFKFQEEDRVIIYLNNLAMMPKIINLFMPRAFWVPPW